jgi:hypothetical protein
MTTITSSLWDLARRLIVALALASAVILAPAFGILANVGTATVSAQSNAVSAQADPGSINGGNNDPHRFYQYSPELAVPH